MALKERPSFGQDPEGTKPTASATPLIHLMTDELLDYRNEMKSQGEATAVAAIDEELRRRYGK